MFCDTSGRAIAIEGEGRGRGRLATCIVSQVIIDKVEMNCSNLGSQEEEKGGRGGGMQATTTMQEL